MKQLEELCKEECGKVTQDQSIERDWKQWNKTDATQQNTKLMYSILLERVILKFAKKKNGFNHEFLIFLPHTTKTTLQDITDQISGRIVNIN